MAARKVLLDIVSVIWDYGGVFFLSAVIIWLGLRLLYRKQNLWTLVLLTYIFIVLNITLLDRGYIAEPFKYFLTGFSFFLENGNVNYETAENCFMLLILLSGLSGCSLKAWQSFLLCLGFSAFIEIMQVIFHLGATQLSDVVYNTLGGIIGWCIYKIILSTSNRLKH